MARAGRDKEHFKVLELLGGHLSNAISLSHSELLHFQHQNCYISVLEWLHISVLIELLHFSVFLILLVSVLKLYRTHYIEIPAVTQLSIGIVTQSVRCQMWLNSKYCDCCISKYSSCYIPVRYLSNRIVTYPSIWVVTYLSSVALYVSVLEF